MEIKVLSDEQAENAIREGGIPGELVQNNPCLAVILTQSWCSDWAELRASLGELDTLDKADKLSIFVYEYDKSPVRERFTQFKEATFRNEFIPFVLVYSNGELIAQGNFHHSSEIAQALTDGAAPA